MLKTNPQARRLDERTQLAAVAAALADGTATARELRQRFPGQTTRKIAEELRIPVVATDDDPMVGPIWRFAEYHARPPKIVLYTRGLEPLERALAGGLAAQRLGRATTEEVFIAHELYHHAEAIRPEVPIARRFQATLFKVGNWQWRTGIAMLSEIAAGSFAQALLDLPCHPKALDDLARPHARICCGSSSVGPTASLS
jgi:hypothetical protein